MRLDSELLDRELSEDVETLSSVELDVKCRSSSDVDDTGVFDLWALNISSGGMLGW
jgi:hypothetical protein